MTRIDMSRMVQSAPPVKNSTTPPDSSDSKTDFASKLKEKEQPVQEEAKKPRPEKEEEGKGTEEAKDSHKKKQEPGLPGKNADLQVTAEAMLKLQETLNQLVENHVPASKQGHETLAAALTGTKLAGTVQKEGTVLPQVQAGKAVLKETMAMAGHVTGKELLEAAAKTDQTPLAMVKEASGEKPGAETKHHEGAGKEPAQAKIAGNTAQSPKAAQPVHKEGFSGKHEPDPGEGKAHNPRAGEEAATHNIQNTGNHTLFRETPVREQAETVTMRTTPETFAPDLGRVLAAKLPGNNGTLSIELEPESLGKMTIKVVYEAGRAAVSIMSANPKTLELLSQSAGDIAQILEQKTGQQTVVYTPQQPQQDMDGRQGGQEGGGRGQDQDQEHQRRQGQPDSFAQQLRLGLV